MPWTKDRYPDSMKNLTAKTRAAAIEIANKLLDEGHEEGSAIAIGIPTAEKWAENRGIQPKKKQKVDGVR